VSPHFIASAALLWYLAQYGSSLVFCAVASMVCVLSWRFQVVGPYPERADMQGKVCIVTGSSSGIGLATAEELLRMGAHVILACRSEKKALEARDLILSQCTGSKGCAEFLQLDLCSFASVRAFAKAFKAKSLPLHVLVNNAGVMQSERKLTADGNEMTMQANYLGHFLLTNLLLDRLKETPGGARIVNISSSMHWGEKHFDFDDMQGEHNYAMFRSYEQSKLAQLLSTMELERRLQGTAVTVNAVHPGTVVTDVTRDFVPWLRWAESCTKPLQYILRKSRQAGAYTAVHCAVAPSIAGMSGKYWWNCREEPCSPLVHDRAVQKRLWEVTEKLVAL